MALKKSKKESNKVTVDWNKLSGTISLFAHETDDGRVLYSTSLGTKYDNGEWENVYITVRFSKKAEEKCMPDEPGLFYVYMIEAWLRAEFWTAGKGKNAERRSAVVLFINDAEPVENE